MAFTQELKPGFVIFRRADVQHRNWYCRVKHGRQYLAKKRRAALLGQLAGDRFSTRSDEKIERDQQRRGDSGKLAEAAGRRMDALQQGIERERLAGGDHDLSFEHEPPRLKGAERRDQIGEISRHRAAGLGAQFDRGAVAKRQTTKAVPFRGEDRDVLVYFDNDQKAAAPADARRLIALLGR